MRKYLTLLACLLMMTGPGVAAADDLTRTVQEDLTALGYDCGPVDGEMNMQTAIAIAKFQAENGLEVTGEATPQLAGILKAVRDGKYQAAAKPAPPQNPSPVSAAEARKDLQAHQQACLEEKAEAAEKRRKKKRAFGRLASAAGRAGSRFGVGQDIAKVSRDVYDANATANDISAAAKDLGLTEDEVEECRNPPVKKAADAEP